MNKYMITQDDTKNVVFTEEQNNQLEQFKARLSNVQYEINGANKVLTGLNNDCTRISAERTYQQDLLDKVNVSVEEANSKFNSLNEEVLTLTQKISTLNKEIEEKTKDLNSRESSVKDREDATSLKEQEVLALKVKLQDDIDSFGEEREQFTQKVDKLKDLASTI